MIEWNSDYLTGVEDIDLQHQYFAKLINRIEAKITGIALAEGHSPLLTELVYYTRFHFLSEENLMTEVDYPEIDAHKRLHSDLIQRLNNEIHMLESDLVEPAHIVEMLGMPEADKETMWTRPAMVRWEPPPWSDGCESWKSASSSCLQRVLPAPRNCW